MDCTRFTAQLEGLLDGDLPAEARANAAQHAAGCPDCRALLASMQGKSSPAVEAPDGLTEAILGQTSGAACGQAQALLGDFVDGLLATADHELVDAHLRHCRACAAVAAALVRLAEDLPAFDAAPPDPQLVADVLARTRPRRPWWAAVHDQVRAAVLRLLARPRIAWEAGCVAALVAWLTCGASWSPLRATAVEAQVLMQQGAAEAHELGARSLGAIGRQVAAVGERGASVAIDGAGSVAGGFLDALFARYQRASGAAPDLGRHWRQLAWALRDRDLFSGVDALRGLSRDAGAMLAELLLSPLDSATSTPAASDAADRSR